MPFKGTKRPLDYSLGCRLPTYRNTLPPVHNLTSSLDSRSLLRRMEVDQACLKLPVRMYTVEDYIARLYWINTVVMYNKFLCNGLKFRTRSQCKQGKSSPVLLSWIVIIRNSSRSRHITSFVHFVAKRSN